MVFGKMEAADLQKFLNGEPSKGKMNIVKIKLPKLQPFQSQFQQEVDLYCLLFLEQMV